MSESQHTRKKFLKLFGLSVGAALVSTDVFANSPVAEEIRELTASQQKFLLGYEKWMDEFIEVIKVKKADPDNSDNKKRMHALTERAEKFKPEINEFMKDKTFSLVYRKSIERMTKEI